MAVTGFKGFGWLMCGVVVSPMFYLVSSRVAAERGRLEAVDRAILEAKRDIRTLETEFGTRANFAQLERWNGDVLALAAPRPEQYAGGEQVLASLQPAGLQRAETANLVVPAALPAIEAADAAVLAAAEAEKARPAAGAVGPVKVIKVAGPVPALRTPAPAVQASRAPIRPIVAASAPVPTTGATAMPRKPQPRPTAVAMLDRKLLDDSTMGELMSDARAERGGKRR